MPSVWTSARGSRATSAPLIWNVTASGPTRTSSRFSTDHSASGPYVAIASSPSTE